MLLWFTCLYKYKYYKTYYGKPKIDFKGKVNCLAPPMTPSSVFLEAYTYSKILQIRKFYELATPLVQLSREFFNL